MQGRENEKMLAAQEAVKLVRNGQVVGLGTGSTAYYAITAISEMVRQGLGIVAIPTSEKTRALAASLHIPLAEISSVQSIDISIDGADEFTESGMLIKGGGGALLREKIVARMSKQSIIIADASKKVNRLGKFRVPVAVIPFAQAYAAAALTAMDGRCELRLQEGKPFVTDDGNYIIDADFGLIEDAVTLAAELDKIEAVVAHGIFINLAHRIIVGMEQSTKSFDFKIT